MPSPKRPKTSPTAADQNTIGFDFIKSNFFRVVHCDGVYGGINPNGQFHMAVFSERSPFPAKIVHRVDGNRLGDEVRREGRTGIVREIEVDVVMNIDQALEIRKWLDQKIAQHQSIFEPTLRKHEGES